MPKACRPGPIASQSRRQAKSPFSNGDLAEPGDGFGDQGDRTREDLIVFRQDKNRREAAERTEGPLCPLTVSHQDKKPEETRREAAERTEGPLNF